MNILLFSYLPHQCFLNQTKVFDEYIPKLFFPKITKKNILFAKINKIKKSKKTFCKKTSRTTLFYILTDICLISP